MKKFTYTIKSMLFISIFVFLLLTGYELMRSNQSEPTSVQGHPGVSMNAQHSVAKIAEESAESNAHSSLSSNSTVIAGVASTAAVTPAWLISYESQPSMPVPDGVVEYEPVSIDMSSPAYPSSGQRVSLGLTNGDVVSATVASSNESPNGDYSWRGHLDGYGTQYPVIMTYGANSVFATITTPKGSYTLESADGNGWIYKNPSEFELSEPGKNDYQEIPDAHAH